MISIPLTFSRVSFTQQVRDRWGIQPPGSDITQRHRSTQRTATEGRQGGLGTCSLEPEARGRAATLHTRSALGGGGGDQLQASTSSSARSETARLAPPCVPGESGSGQDLFVSPVLATGCSGPHSIAQEPADSLSHCPHRAPFWCAPGRGPSPPASRSLFIPALGFLPLLSFLMLHPAPLLPGPSLVCFPAPITAFCVRSRCPSVD